MAIDLDQCKCYKVCPVESFMEEVDENGTPCLALLITDDCIHWGCCIVECPISNIRGDNEKTIIVDWTMCYVEGCLLEENKKEA